MNLYRTVTTPNMPPKPLVDCVWNVMEHAQKSDFFSRWNGRVHLNRRERQFSRLLAAEVCVSAVVMLDTPCSEVVWRVLTTHSIRQSTLHFPSPASPCAITFQLDSTLHDTLCCPLEWFLSLSLSQSLSLSLSLSLYGILLDGLFWNTANSPQNGDYVPKHNA